MTQMLRSIQVQQEICNALDDDCDGEVDEGGICIPDIESDLVGHWMFNNNLEDETQTIIQGTVQVVFIIQVGYAVMQMEHWNLMALMTTW